MDQSDPVQSKTDTQRKTSSSEREDDSYLSPPKRSPGPKRQRPDNKCSLPRSRTVNACEGCRKRKTKCSGPPEPCKICRSLDTVCAFTPRSRRRRRRTHSSGADQVKQSYVLEGIFLILKHNSQHDIQTLVELIRSNAQPKDIFSCIRANWRSLQERGLIETCEIDDHDFFALAPTMLLRNQPHTETNLRDGAVKEPSPKAESWTTDPDVPSLPNELVEGTTPDKLKVQPPNHLDRWKNVPEYQPTYDNPDEFFEALGIDEYPLFASMPLDAASLRTLNSKTLPSMERAFRLHTNSTSHVSACVSNPLSTLAMSTSTGLPVSQPESNLDHFTLVFIKYAHQLMSTGTTLGELNNFGIPNCELLFRHRVPEDKYTIPNWACETARHFPSELLPTTRIALALCLMRVVPYLICPSPETLHALPGMLRPTDLQRRLSHRIEHNFIPFPKLRDCMIDHAASSMTNDWIVLLTEQTCRIGWPDTITKVNTSSISPDSLSYPTEEPHHRWAREQQALIMQQLSPENSSAPLPNNSSPQQAEIVVRIPRTGQCHISEHFERACWTYENWSVSKNLLRIWPDLSGHIKVH